MFIMVGLSTVGKNINIPLGIFRHKGPGGSGGSEKYHSQSIVGQKCVAKIADLGLPVAPQYFVQKKLVQITNNCTLGHIYIYTMYMVTGEGSASAT